MANIDKIRLHNFKAFYTGSEPQEISLKGKNLLLYGENGSGKSSIYWALYTLFQSETKTQAEISKYFSPIHEEQLINYHYLNSRPDFTVDENGNITNPNDIGKNAEVTVELEDGVEVRIDKDGNSESVANKIQDLHRHSDFITHRLLVNFYNFRNSKGINLWEVFVRDFFPFLIEDRGRGQKTLWQNLKSIEENLPFNLDTASKTFKRSRSKVWQRNFNDTIRKFNSDVEHYITRINLLSNDVYKDVLKNNDNIEIFLKYNQPLKYDHYADNVYTKDGVDYTQGTGYAKLNNPFISLVIRRVNDDGSFSVVHRPQAYLNEAKITMIALSIRFSLLHDSIKPPYAGQFLALDDLLISLDMSNREKVLEAILNVYAKKYKIYLFTHERSFFNLVKRRIDYGGNISEWEIREIYQITKDDGIPSPEDYPSKGFFSLALQHKNNRPPDYPASMNYLRKELEEILVTNLPKEIFKNDDGTNKDKLNDKIIATKKLFEKLNIDQKVVNEIDDFIFLLLNPMSHSDLESEIYKTDIEKVLTLVANFRKECETLKPLIKRILPRSNKIIMVINKDINTVNEYVVTVSEDVFVYLNPDGSRVSSHSELEKDLICYEVKNSIKGKETKNSINAKQKENLQKFYEYCCNKESVAIDPDFLNFYFLSDKSKNISQIIADL